VVAIVMPINLKNSKTNGPQPRLVHSAEAEARSPRSWADKITRWRDQGDPELESAYCQAGIPSKDITVVYRSRQVRYDEQLPAVPEQHGHRASSVMCEDTMSTAFPGGKPPSNSIAGNKNSGVMAQILSKEGAIGYVDLGDAKGYPAARVQNAWASSLHRRLHRPRATSPTRPTFRSTGLVDLNYKVRAKGAYPIAIFSYALARTDGKGPNGLGVRQFQSTTSSRSAARRALHPLWASSRSAARCWPRLKHLVLPDQVVR
jgi:ABC-type phosphate transport system substrate-binding protein